MTRDALFGSVLDADSHEMIPTPLWQEEFGDTGAEFATVVANRGQGLDAGLNTASLDVHADELPINDGTVWNHDGWVSGPNAPGAISMQRRIEVLDFMGIARQTLFPTFGLVGMLFETMGPEFMRALYRLDPATYHVEYLRNLGRRALDAHNDWAIRNTEAHGDRLNMVGALPARDLDEMIGEAERLIDAGVRALFIPASLPPGGFSPADGEVDRFWRLCEESDATVLIHLAFEDFTKTNRWREIPQFEAERGVSAEFVIDPWTFSTIHMVAELYLTTMILGGVFERFPRLRLGAIECGAFWVAPMAENLDRWAQQFSRRMSKILSMKPSEYVSRNIRATPFYFEPVDEYIDKHGFEDVYCFGSDYPHFEGGKHQLQLFADKLDRLGDDVMQKFFVSNARWIMP